LTKASVLSAEFVDPIVIGGDQHVLEIAPDQIDLDALSITQEFALASPKPMALQEKNFVRPAQIFEQFLRLIQVMGVEFLKADHAIGDGALPKRFFQHVELEVGAVFVGACEKMDQAIGSLAFPGWDEKLGDVA